MTIRTKDKHRRSIDVNLQTRAVEETDEKVIEGYFAVFNSETELFPGAYEEISPGAFDNTLSNDIRALVNHDTQYVLGRNKSNTLDLKVDSRGLWGSIKINEKDTDAMNLLKSVRCSDVDQCTFGFNIINESTEYQYDGTVKWTINEIDLHEISVVTFHAYGDTSVQARMKKKEQIDHRKIDKEKIKLKERLDSVKTINVREKDGTKKKGTRRIDGK